MNSKLQTIRPEKDTDKDTKTTIFIGTPMQKHV